MIIVTFHYLQEMPLSVLLMKLLTVTCYFLLTSINFLLVTLLCVIAFTHINLKRINVSASTMLHCCSIVPQVVGVRHSSTGLQPNCLHSSQTPYHSMFCFSFSVTGIFF